MSVEQRSAGGALKEKAEHEHDKREDDLHICAVQRAVGRRGELASDDLHAVLQVDPRDEEAEGIAREARHVLQEVTP